MQETREHIKSRMLKNVARLWGYSDVEAESNFDPLVSMLLGACATELEKISGDIHASRARVMERLVQLLSPDTLTGALPAHAVAGASPIEATAELKPDMQFYTRLKQGVSNENQETSSKDVFFSPSGHFNLNRASIKIMATGRNLININGTQKDFIVSDHGSLPASTVWLGIDEPGLSLNKTLFYFDFRSESGKDVFYHHLPKARWFYNDRQLTALPGYRHGETFEKELDVENLLAPEYKVFHKIKNHINAFYQPFFITLSDEAGLTGEKEPAPALPTLFDVFKGKEADQVREQALRWIEVRFPESISNSLLQEISCTMNCFPVVNRQLHEVNFRLQDHINVIPLRSEDHFLDIEGIVTEDNESLGLRSLDREKQESYAMLMRNGGIGRFDERDAASIIDYLLQLLRDESAAFSIMDNDFVNREVKNLQQVMNKLEQKLYSRQVQQGSSPYLVIRLGQKMPKANLLIKYCSTQGQEANHIKPGTRLLPYNGSSFISNSVFLVSASQGGRDRLSCTEKILAYRSALLSKDRLVTAEDIKAFCYGQLGDRLQKVSILKGVKIHPDEQGGYVKTIDVQLDLKEEAFRKMEQYGELGFWKDNLSLLLEERSNTWMPYRVILKKAS